MHFKHLICTLSISYDIFPSFVTTLQRSLNPSSVLYIHMFLCTIHQSDVNSICFRKEQIYLVTFQMDKKRKSQFSSKESYERSSPPMSKPERSRSPHRSAHKEKSHRSRSPHVSSRTRESHRSGSPHRSSHTSRSHKSRSHHESSAQSERSSKSQLFQEKEDLQGKDAECWMSSPSGKWQVQTKHTGGREEQLPRAKSGSETSCLIADYQSQMQNTR